MECWFPSTLAPSADGGVRGSLNEQSNNSLGALRKPRSAVIEAEPNGEATAAMQGLRSVVMFLGFGSPAEKSEALFAVSVQPLLPLETDLELLGATVGPTP